MDSAYRTPLQDYEISRSWNKGRISSNTSARIRWKKEKLIKWVKGKLFKEKFLSTTFRRFYDIFAECDSDILIEIWSLWVKPHWTKKDISDGRNTTIPSPFPTRWVLPSLVLRFHFSFAGCGRSGYEIRHSVTRPKRVCASQKGMVFRSWALSRVYNFTV